MNLEVKLTGLARGESGRFARMPDELRVALAEKMSGLGDVLYEKVMVNLSGGILERKTGQLAGSIQKHIESRGNRVDVFVGPVPATAKAWALEIGGSGYYPIDPVRAKMLHFISKSGQEVFTPHVEHPPSKEFRYLSLALEETAAEVEDGILAVLDNVFATLSSRDV